MKTKALTTEQLAERWKMHPQTLVNWRSQGKGPKHFTVKRPGKRPAIRYSVAAVQSYERENTEL